MYGVLRGILKYDTLCTKLHFDAYNVAVNKSHGFVNKNLEGNESNLNGLKWNKGVFALEAVFLALILGFAGCGKKEVALSYLDSIAEPIYAESAGDGEDIRTPEISVDAQETANTGNSLIQGNESNEQTDRDKSLNESSYESLQVVGDSQNEGSRQNGVQIDPLGETMETRIGVPYGYQRVEAQEGSFARFLRDYPLKPAGSKVLLYDGSEKANQNDHIAVFALPLEEYDLQQCADSVMRMYGEYYFATEQYDKIKFHFTNGFLAEYTKWRDGNRITVNGNNVTWVKSKSKDTSYECLIRYFRTVFCYAGTLSMESESVPTTLRNIKAGDVFLNGGSPGHVVMVVDVCENEEGKKAFLLAQGYMPAQEFHLLKNPAHSDDPWYYEEEVTYPFYTPEYVFQEGSLKSLNY